MTLDALSSCTSSSLCHLSFSNTVSLNSTSSPSSMGFGVPASPSQLSLLLLEDSGSSLPSAPILEEHYPTPK